VAVGADGALTAADRTARTPAFAQPTREVLRAETLQIEVAEAKIEWPDQQALPVMRCRA
jgi:hypothetical protein